MGGPDVVPVSDPPGTLFISGASGIEITVKAAEGTVIGVPYYWQDSVWQPLLGDATVAPRQVKAIAAGVDVGHLYFNKPATPLWFAVLETGGGTVSFCDIREADGTATLGLQEVSGAGGGGGGGDATAANQVIGNASLASIDGKLTAPLSVTGPLTDTQLRASAVSVTGPLTDAQLRASAVPVSAASLPLPTGAATAANQTNGTQLAQVSNGTNSAGVLNTAPVGTEYGLLVRTLGSTSATITSIPYSGLTAAAVPVQAAYVGGADSNGLLRGFASNADNDANPSSGKMVTMPAVTKNTTPTWQNNKVVPLWVDTSSALLMTSAAQGAAAATASAWPVKVTDGTNTVTLANSVPTSSAYALPVRLTQPASSSSAMTQITGVTGSAFTTVFAANPNAQYRYIYNASDQTVYIGFASSPAGAYSFAINSRQTYEFPVRADGFCVWRGLVVATLESPLFTATLNATEIS